MKKFLLNLLNVVLTLIMVASAIYAVFNLTMSFLPAEIQAEVYGRLHMSPEYIATFSISATVNAAVLITTKILQTYTRITLTAKLAKAEKVMSQTTAVNDIVVSRANEIINNINVLQELNDALLTVQKITTERNIKSSDKLVYKSEKEAYKKALDDIEKAKEKLAKIKNITTVYEKTEIKEVIVEKEEQDKLSGRV